MLWSYLGLQQEIFFKFNLNLSFSLFLRGKETHAYMQSSYYNFQFVTCTIYFFIAK